MDSGRPPRTPPIGGNPPLDFSDKFNERVDRGLFGDDPMAAFTRQSAPPQNGIDPNGYAKSTKTASAKAVSLAERVKRKDPVFDFPIPELDEDGEEPFVARVRKPSILALIESGTLPVGLRKIVDKMIASGDADKSTDQLGQDIIADEGAVSAFGSLIHLVNHLCITGFVEPRVVASEEEADQDPGAVVVSQLPLEARMRFWGLIQGEAKEMTEAAATFPGTTVEPGDPGIDVRIDGVSGF